MFTNSPCLWNAAFCECLCWGNNHEPAEINSEVLLCQEVTESSMQTGAGAEVTLVESFPICWAALTVSYYCLPAATPPCVLYFCAAQTSKINMFPSTEKLMNFSINVTDKMKSSWEIRLPVWKHLCVIRALCNIPIKLLGGVLLVQGTFGDWSFRCFSRDHLFVNIVRVRNGYLGTECDVVSWPENSPMPLMTKSKAALMCPLLPVEKPLSKLLL